jgi:hypothetical protein
MKKTFLLFLFLLFVTNGFSQVQIQDISSKKQKNNDVSESNNSEKIFEFNFGIEGGVFFPNSSAVSDIYGKFLPAGNINFSFWLSNIALRLDFNGIYKTGLPISNDFNSNTEISSKLFMFPTSLSFFYRFKTKSLISKYNYPYIGVGAGVNILYESIKITSLDYSNSETKYPIDISATLGIKLNKLTIEARYSRSIIDASTGAGGANCNVGGLMIALGLRW